MEGNNINMKSKQLYLGKRQTYWCNQGWAPRGGKEHNHIREKLNYNQHEIYFYRCALCEDYFKSKKDLENHNTEHKEDIDKT